MEELPHRHITAKTNLQCLLTGYSYMQPLVRFDSDCFPSINAYICERFHMNPSPTYILLSVIFTGTHKLF